MSHQPEAFFVPKKDECETVTGTLWHLEKCSPRIKDGIPFQIIPDQSRFYINCLNRTLTIKDEKVKCENTIHAVDIGTTFSIDNQTFTTRNIIHQPERFMANISEQEFNLLPKPRLRYERHGEAAEKR